MDVDREIGRMIREAYIRAGVPEELRHCEEAFRGSKYVDRQLVEKMVAPCKSLVMTRFWSSPIGVDLASKISMLREGVMSR